MSGSGVDQSTNVLPAATGLRWSLADLDRFGVDTRDADAFRSPMDFPPCDVVEDLELAEELWRLERTYGRAVAWKHLMDKADEQGGLYVH